MKTQFDNGYALLIGVNEHVNPNNNLPAVVKDIAALYQVLKDPQRCAYPENNVKVVSGSDATKKNILNHLDWLRDELEEGPENSTAIIYYSGHGFRDTSNQNQFYFVPYDGTNSKTLLRDTDFERRVSAMSAKRVLIILDCCHANESKVKVFKLEGATSKQFDSSTPSPDNFYIKQEAAYSNLDGTPKRKSKSFSTLADGVGRATLFSSTAEEESWIWNDGRMSIFTWHLIKALQGKGRTDADSKEVLVTDMMSFVAREVPESVYKEHGKSQNPRFKFDGSSFPIALIKGGKGLSKGESVPEVVDPTKQTLAEVEQAASVIHKVDIDGNDNIVNQGVSNSTIKISQGSRTAHNTTNNTTNNNSTSIGSISGSQGFTVGTSASSNMTGSNFTMNQNEGDELENISDLFQTVRQLIERRQEDSEVDKDELADKSTRIQKEVIKGDQANLPKIERWFNDLKEMAPDVLEVIASGLINPRVAIAQGIRVIAQKLKQPS